MSGRANLVLKLAFIPVAAQLGLSKSAGAQSDATQVYETGRQSVVFIETVLQNRDGTNKDKFHSTGFIVSEKGHAITVAHAVPRAADSQVAEYRASLNTRYGPQLPIEVISRDENLDLALIIMPGLAQPKAVSIISSSKVPVGAGIYAIGFPFTSDVSLSQGVVSSLFGPGGRWQTTLPLNPGHSGAPIFDIGGRVVGIAWGGRELAQAITYVIPSDYLYSMLQLVSIPVHPTNPTQKPTAPQPSAKSTEKVTQDFPFSLTVDHEEQREFEQEFCFPIGTRVLSAATVVQSQNGNGTRIIFQGPSPARPNCVLLKTFVAGLGVDKIGSIIVNHRGRGWIGGVIQATAER